MFSYPHPSTACQSEELGSAVSLQQHYPRSANSTRAGTHSHTLFMQTLSTCTHKKNILSMCVCVYDAKPASNQAFSAAETVKQAEIDRCLKGDLQPPHPSSRSHSDCFLKLPSSGPQSTQECVLQSVGLPIHALPE